MNIICGEQSLKSSHNKKQKKKKSPGTIQFIRANKTTVVHIYQKGEAEGIHKTTAWTIKAQIPTACFFPFWKECLERLITV